MNGYYPRIALACLVTMVVGCASAPVRYYTLTPPSEKTRSVSQRTLEINARVVHLPPQLNRVELMVRTGPAEVALLDNERWASSLNDEIKDAMRLELQRRLGRISGLPLAFTKLTLDVDVQHLEAQLGQYALLEASWSASSSVTESASAGTRTISGVFRAEEPIEAGYAGMVEGYQREIAALADAVVANWTADVSGSMGH